jgi:hypothetical protein
VSDQLEQRIREIAREEVIAELDRRRSDRPEDPVNGGQIRLVHAKRSAAGITKDELKAHLGEAYGIESLTELPQTKLDDVLDWIESSPGRSDA